MDDLLRFVWLRFFEADTPDRVDGSRRLRPRRAAPRLSDVDIMILLMKRTLEARRSELEAFMAFLWDIGLEVGHSVRTLEDCVHEGAADITVATSLMEARLLIGTSVLFEQMRAATGPDRIWPDTAFFESKQRERCQRYHKYNETAFNLEPNIKDGPGGLRDMQMIGWVAKRHFGVSTPQELVSHGFLSPSEYDELIDCRNFLAGALRPAYADRPPRRHVAVRSPAPDRPAVRLPGSGAKPGCRAVHAALLPHRQRASRLNEMLLQLFEEAILLADEPGEPQPINRRFQVRRAT